MDFCIFVNFSLQDTREELFGNVSQVVCVKFDRLEVLSINSSH